MNIRVLRYFLSVAREENISNAAKTLHVTQPTLSRQLMELEADLGVKLFLRSSGNRSITLTEEGMLLRKRAEEILDLVEKTELELAAPGERISGNIHIGSGETPVIGLLSKEIKHIRDEHPNIHFHFFSGNADSVTERLDNGLIDFGVLAESPNIAKYDSIALPAADTWGLLMRKDHPLSKKDFIQAGDLTNIPLINSSQRMTSHAFSKWLKDDYEKLNLVATYTLLYNASLLVKDNIGCALCLDKIISTPEDSELCFRPLKPKLEARWYIVWKKYQVFSKAADIFLKRLQEKFAG
ncbi:LysR family transcriptional regulator [Faecalicatena contorta]|uniref:DNA-binding transcriptional regulator, LysR family n=1 Tax=Faecalicatena contorta TaxID=39482 RepID=A0A316A1N6_9FIRM|nr:LysR family transcriptional regulator [Faecalicatena contorta]PWJ51493.1 DNA-binding transcriptional LysR family regulator [Faecalicatena contorta]SUQ13049.1 DNA-binding transcriptional regulator, LysR family [Faecalicatena contorta]